MALFNRTANGVSLTTEGERYLITVVNALGELNSAGEALKKSIKQLKLLLDVIPSISNIWLIPRIHRVEQRFPHLKVDLVSGDGPPDFNQSPADICIRCLLPNPKQ